MTTTVDTNGSNQMNSVEISYPAKNDSSQMVKHNANLFTGILGPELDASRFLISAVDASNQLTKPCQPATVCRSVFNAGSLGLMFGDALGHCYLVPFKNGQLSKGGPDVYDCQLIIGYRGFVELALRNGFITDLTTEVVLQGEDFRMWVDSSGRQIQHEIPLSRSLSANNVANKVVGSYCVYHTQTGGTGIVWVEKSEIDAAKNATSDAWKYAYVAMAKKTAVRRASKEWRLTDQLAAAIQLDEQAERGERQPCSQSFTPIEGPNGDTFSLGGNGDQPEQGKPAAFELYRGDIANATNTEAVEMLERDMEAENNLGVFTAEEYSQLQEEALVRKKSFE